MYCKCGCGGITSIIKSADKKRGYVVGEYRKYINNHHSFGNKNTLGMIPWNKGKTCSEEARLKMRLSHLGKKLSEETKKKLSKGMIGKNTWMKGKKHTEETKEKIRKASTGRKIKRPDGFNVWNKGISHKKIIGENHWNWQGGKVKAKEKIRKSVEYKNWRRTVFVRDEFTCQECGINNIYIEAHHIKSWKNFPELRFKLENGVALCTDCHKKTNNYGQGASTEVDALR